MKQGTLFLVLHKQIVRAKGWQKGEDLKIEIDGKGKLIVERVKNHT